MIDSGAVNENDIFPECLVRHTFFNVDYIAPYDDDSTEINVCGESYICAEPYEKVLYRIKQQQVFIRN